jgi:hypothetical protein
MTNTHDTTPTHPLPAHPNTRHAAHSLKAIGQVISQNLTANDMLEMLRASLATDASGAAMLFTQAQVLDALFHRLTMKALSGADEAGQPLPDYVHEGQVHLALRTQKQCRSTVEALALLRAAEAGKAKELEKTQDDPRYRY